MSKSNIQNQMVKSVIDLLKIYPDMIKDMEDNLFKYSIITNSISVDQTLKKIKENIEIQKSFVDDIALSLIAIS